MLHFDDSNWLSRLVLRLHDLISKGRLGGIVEVDGGIVHRNWRRWARIIRIGSSMIHRRYILLRRATVWRWHRRILLLGIQGHHLRTMRRRLPIQHTRLAIGIHWDVKGIRRLADSRCRIRIEVAHVRNGDRLVRLRVHVVELGRRNIGGVTNASRATRAGCSGCRHNLLRLKRALFHHSATAHDRQLAVKCRSTTANRKPT